MENRKNQNYVLKSLFDENIDGINDGIIKEIKQQLRNRHKFNIGEILKPKNPNKKTSKKRTKHCPTCVCGVPAVAAGFDNRATAHSREGMPGAFAARFEREAEMEIVDRSDANSEAIAEVDETMNASVSKI